MPSASKQAPIASDVKAAPSVRLMARKLGVDLTRIHGSGPGGRILVQDLAADGPAVDPKPVQETRPPAADHGQPGTRVKLAGLRRQIAAHMVRSRQSIPDYTYVDECDVSELVRLREALRDRFAREEIKLTYLAFVVKAAALALKAVPLVNASLDEEKEEIVLHDRYDIGVATATPAGLVVPVVRGADRKSLAEIARDIQRLGEEARSGKSKRDDLRGGTFTVTSIGNIGGLFSTPVINHPEVGIAGVGKIVKRPIVDATGLIRAADMLYLSFTFDHRVVDGAVGATFGNALMAQLANPAALLLPEKLN